MKKKLLPYINHMVNTSYLIKIFLETIWNIKENNEIISIKKLEILKIQGVHTI
jgi:hypothetical protein